MRGKEKPNLAERLAQTLRTMDEKVDTAEEELGDAVRKRRESEIEAAKRAFLRKPAKSEDNKPSD